MSWALSDKESTAVPQLDGRQRYRYWLKKVADKGVLWSLFQDDGWALAGDSQGKLFVPVWPHERFAAICATGAWTGFVPKAIDIDAWINRWIPGMKRDSRRVVVFPTPNDRGFVVDPPTILADLNEELEKYG